MLLVWDKLFNSHSHDMARRERGCQLSIALIGDRNDGPRLSNQKICTRYPNIGAHIFVTKLMTRTGHQVFYVIGSPGLGVVFGE